MTYDIYLVTDSERRRIRDVYVAYPYYDPAGMAEEFTDALEEINPKDLEILSALKNGAHIEAVLADYCNEYIFSKDKEHVYIARKNWRGEMTYRTMDVGSFMIEHVENCTSTPDRFFFNELWAEDRAEVFMNESHTISEKEFLKGIGAA